MNFDASDVSIILEEVIENSKNCKAQCSGSLPCAPYEYKCTTYPDDVSVYVEPLFQIHYA